MRYVIQFTVFFAILNISAQSPEEYRKVKDNEIDSILNIYQENENLKFLSFLPSINYDALNNSFNVGISISNISTFIQNRKRNKIELARLEADLNNQADQDFQKIEFEIMNFRQDLNEFLFELRNLEIYGQLFEIQIGKHKAGEITTEDFLKEKLDFTQKLNSYLNKIERLKIVATKINLKIDFKVYTEILDFAKEKLLQREKNFGLLRAAPLSVFRE